MELFIHILIGAVIGGLITWIILKLVFEKNSVPKKEYDEVEKKLNEANFLIGKLEERNTTLADAEKMFDEKLENKFKVLANEIFDDKNKKLKEENQQTIKQILDPLGTDIKDFKQKVEDYYIKESNQRFSLQTEIKKLFDLNQQLSGDAKNLTKALTGDTKAMGNWGEEILERILEKAGLIKGREYLIQESYRNTEGSLLRPDVIVNLPDNRCIVIDSKVSITAYEKFISSEETEDQKRFLKEHVNSLYNHIEGLSKKNYSDLLGEKSLDFVFMFVHVEPAYYTAQQSDPDIWHYAYSKGIILVSPSILISAMKLIADLWKRDKQSKNAIEIAERGGLLYDKFVSFVEKLRDIGFHLNKSQNSYKEAIEQLSEGRGNLVRQAEQLKQLGAKTKKEMPEKLLERSNESDDEVNL
ncbi:MAG: DNA recombination protein RmuC [Chitinophagales bacterium]